MRRRGGEVGRFHDRQDAGRRLAPLVVALQLHQPLVLALPRGGVPVAAEVARSLHAPFDVLVARKIGAPHQPELGIGAVAEGGGIVIDDAAVRAMGITSTELTVLADAALDELHRRVRAYRGERALPSFAGRAVVVVDDGIATGVTAEAALRAVRRSGPARLVLAVPVCPPDSASRLRSVADEVVSVVTTRQLGSVGHWYEDFTQTTDAEVSRLLAGGPVPNDDTP
jgi:predicted phosphoribosyltransferase